MHWFNSRRCRRNSVIAVLLLFLNAPSVHAEDGTYDATVTTDSGSYTVPVEVEDGEVTYVHWPNGGDMHVYGAEIENGEASGYNSRGESISIAVDGYEPEGDEE